MADCQEWKGQRFKKMYVRKTTQYEEKFFKLFFKGMIRFDLNMEHDEVYGNIVFVQYCIFARNLPIAKKQTLLLFHKRYN